MQFNLSLRVGTVAERCDAAGPERGGTGKALVDLPHLDEGIHLCGRRNCRASKRRMNKVSVDLAKRSLNANRSNHHVQGQRRRVLIAQFVSK